MKQIYDLNRSDIMKNPVWIFPMNDSCDDELTVEPLDCNADFHFEKQIIVQTKFITSKGSEYVGYIYWGKPHDVCCIQPVMYVNDTDYITFWNGLAIPSWDEYPENVREVEKELPIRFTSFNLKSFYEISGTLEGLYYLENREEKILIKSMGSD